MTTTGRDTLSHSIDALTGKPGDCTESMLIQSRSPWTVAAVLGISIPAFVLGLWAGLERVPAALLAGLVMALIFNALTSMWVLARTPDGVLLARSTNRQATAIEKTFAHPLPVEERSFRILRRVSIDGQGYVITRRASELFDSIVGANAG